MIELRCVSKSFPGVKALDCVDLKFHEGEVHVILGENGAGKSTLASILYGIYLPDSGKILVDGRETTIGSPKAALKLGIALVSQQYALIDELTVLENLLLAGVSPRAFSVEAERLGLRLGLDNRVGDLSLGEKQRIEIVKALSRGARLLIFDEPTAVLAPREIEGLFHMVRSLRSRGVGIVLITHRIGEALAVGDRVTVLRRGRVAGQYLAREATAEVLVRAMFGKLVEVPGRAKTSKGKLVLSVRGIYVDGTVKGIDLDVYGGEIVGIAGVVGNGQRELLEVLGGYRRPNRGTIVVDGVDLTGKPTSKFVEMGVSFIPEDRELAVAKSLTIVENLVMRSRPPIIRWGDLRRTAVEIMSRLDIEAPSPETPVGRLSGGNMQKVVVGREALHLRPKVLVAIYPTRGLDYETSMRLYSIFQAIKGGGGSIIFSSEDVNELASISDRILVMRGGRIVGEYGPGTPLERVAAAMADAN